MLNQGLGTLNQMKEIEKQLINKGFKMKRCKDVES